MIKALIFDLDGTLLDTIEDITNSANHSLALHHQKTYGIPEYKLFVGDGVDMLVKRILGNNTDLFDSVKKEYLNHYTIHQFDKTKPYDGIVELLQYAQQSGISVNVLSNKPDVDTKRIVQRFFPEIAFQEVFGKKPEFLPKPNPESVLDLIRKLHLETSEILYVGDTLTDMKTALNAGLKKIGCLWGFRNLEELKQGHPEYIVSHPSEIISILKEETK